MGVGLILCTETEMPVFAEQKQIIVVDCICSEHFHAYKVFGSDEKVVVKKDSLVIYKPFDLHCAYGGDEIYFIYIVPLFSL